MRRFAFTLAATGLLFVFAPAAALAHHHRTRSHGARSHHLRIRRFGDVNSQPTTSSSADNAGTVVSFTGGVLTIQLSDGSAVSGTVTNDTEIECAASGQSQSSGEDQSSGTEDQGDQSSGSGDQSSGSGDQSSGTEDQGDSGSTCSTADLAAGKAVHAAELQISSTGKTWDKVELGS